MAQEFTVEQLKQYDGSGAEGQIYVCVDGVVFDVTEKGKQHYGPGGAYSIFAGKEASRGLATMNMVVKDTKDDLTDLSDKDNESLQRWKKQFSDKYSVIGKLV